MSSQVRRSLALALAGLAAGLGLVLALYEGPGVLRRATGHWPAEAPAAPPTAGTPPAAEGPGAAAPPARDASQAPARDTADRGPPARGTPAQDVLEQETRGQGAPGQGTSGQEARGQAGPRFDVVRVEPNGDAVVAGRGTPNTVVEMLVDGKPVARALADPDGQFAIVPPALPAGSSEIVLRTKDVDGRETRSKQSVAVAVAPGRDKAPLVALTDPDRPTVVLSQPGAPGSPRQPGTAVAAKPEAKPGAKPESGPTTAGPTRVVSVDAEPGGRLYVTGAAPPGAQVRLYLNDTPVAPATAGPDGRVIFTIGRGVRPGRYRVRIDQLDPATGRVSGRAEVPFTVPEAVVAGPAPVETPRVAGMAASPAGRPAAAPEPRRAQSQAAPEASPPARPEAAAPGRAAATGPGRTAADPAPEPGAPPSGEGRTGAVFVPEISTARIIRGDSLWQISKRIYGRGERYTVIYDANQQQIRNPDLIYPGQIFVLPDKRG